MADTSTRIAPILRIAARQDLAWITNANQLHVLAAALQQRQVLRASALCTISTSGRRLGFTPSTARGAGSVQRFDDSMTGNLGTNNSGKQNAVIAVVRVFNNLVGAWRQAFAVLSGHVHKKAKHFKALQNLPGWWYSPHLTPTVVTGAPVITIKPNALGFVNYP
jgi:hypothetical protein